MNQNLNTSRIFCATQKDNRWSLQNEGCWLAFLLIMSYIMETNQSWSYETSAKKLRANLPKSTKRKNNALDLTEIEMSLFPGSCYLQATSFEPDERFSGRWRHFFQFFVDHYHFLQLFNLFIPIFIFILWRQWAKHWRRGFKRSCCDTLIFLTLRNKTIMTNKKQNITLGWGWTKDGEANSLIDIVRTISFQSISLPKPIEGALKYTK